MPLLVAEPLVEAKPPVVPVWLSDVPDVLEGDVVAPLVLVLSCEPVAAYVLLVPVAADDELA